MVVTGGATVPLRSQSLPTRPSTTVLTGTLFQLAPGQVDMDQREHGTAYSRMPTRGEGGPARACLIRTCLNRSAVAWSPMPAPGSVV